MKVDGLISTPDVRIDRLITKACITGDHATDKRIDFINGRWKRTTPCGGERWRPGSMQLFGPHPAPLIKTKRLGLCECECHV